MREPQTNLTLLTKALKRLQSAFLATTVGIVQPAEDVSVALAINYCRAVEIRKDFDWIFYWQDGRRADVLVES